MATLPPGLGQHDLGAAGKNKLRNVSCQRAVVWQWGCFPNGLTLSLDEFTGFSLSLAEAKKLVCSFVWEFVLMPVLPFHVNPQVVRSSLAQQVALLPVAQGIAPGLPMLNQDTVSLRFSAAASDVPKNEAELREQALAILNQTKVPDLTAERQRALIQKFNQLHKRATEAGIPLNLSGVNLAGADLERVDLAGANLWEANFQGANLAGANLTDAKLWGANLEEVNLMEAKLWYEMPIFGDVGGAEATE
ncbi:MAG: pentapeptide repeat-containing protein [Candidatus Melainabacteria bacterium]|nr:pentapeptide repeat-containing protein [Candidatus Melainabacteria bacterium]